MQTHVTYEADNENPVERKRFIQELFDSIVPSYDSLNHVLSFGTDARWRKDMIHCMGDLEGRMVIDLCCGTGDVSRLLSQRGAKTVSLDFSLKMLHQGIRKKALTSDSIMADASVLPFKSNTFDAATIAFGIRNIPDLDRFMEEVHRMLKQDGQLTILELVRPKSRIIRVPYSFYLSRLLPLIGGIMSGRPLAYRYLSGTIATFVHPLTIQKMLEKHGFTSVSHSPKTFGVATVIVCSKGTQ